MQGSSDDPTRSNESFANKALSQLRHKLLDLTARNRLLNFKLTQTIIQIVDELPSQTVTSLIEEEKSLHLKPLPDLEVSGSAPGPLFSDDDAPGKNVLTDAVKTRLLSEFGIHLSPEMPKETFQQAAKHTDDDLQTPLFPRQLETRCRKVARDARTALEETGANTLFLAVGFLEWYELRDQHKTLKAPLLLVPIQIERVRMDKQSNCYCYDISYTGESLETNLSLKERLSGDFDRILPDLPDSPDPEAYLVQVEKAVQGLHRWRVAREMVIGFFSFSKLRMYLDLDSKNWPPGARIAEHTIVQELLGAVNPTDRGEAPEIRDLDAHKDAQQIPLVLDADSSQHTAVLEALNGRSMVIQGPPGTGKSQTIANLIAAAISSGKTVLFVAEKMAALEVVRRRLDHVGLGDFCLELHSWKARKDRVIRDVEKRMNRNFHVEGDRTTENLSKRRDELNQYARLMGSHLGKSGKTIQEVFWAAERGKEDNSSKEYDVGGQIANPQDLSAIDVEERIALLKDLGQLMAQEPQPDLKLWKGFSPVNFYPGDQERVRAILESMHDTLSILSKMLEEANTIPGLSVPSTLEAARSLAGLQIVVLKTYPMQWNHPLAKALIEKNSRDLLARLIGDVKEYRLAILKAAEILDVSRIDEYVLTQLFSAYELLVSKNLGSLTFVEITTVAEDEDRYFRLWNQTSNVIRPWLEVGLKLPSSIMDFENLMKVIRHLYDSPASIKDNCIREHASTLARNAFREARATFIGLNSQNRDIEPLFFIEKLPPSEELEQLAILIRRKRESFWSFLSIPLRRANGAVSLFIRYPAAISSPNLPRMLERLAAWTRQKEAAFENNEWKKHLGPLYKGDPTDWKSLEECINWASTLRNLVGKKTVAQAIIGTLDALHQSGATVKNHCQVLLQLHVLVTGSIKKVADPVPYEIVEKSLPIEEQIQRMRKFLEPFRQLKSGFEERLKDKRTSLSNVGRALIKLRDAHQKAAKIGGTSQYRNLMGNAFMGPETKTDDLLPIMDWIVQLESAGISGAHIAWLLDQAPERSEVLANLCNGFRMKMANLEASFESLRTVGELKEGAFLGDRTVPETISVIHRRRECVATLVPVAEYHRLRTHASRLELDSFVDAMESNRELFTEPDRLYMRTYCNRLARHAMDSHGLLKRFSRISHERIQQEFRTLDRRLLEGIRQTVAQDAARRSIPDGVGKGPVVEWTEKLLLKREMGKKMRHIPIRQLVRRSGKALQALKPCFMMSPLSVAQYLETDQLIFDLVVMDESSQLRPEEALGAVARARQAVVVGDSNQLPPTTFFERTGMNLDEDEQEAAGAMQGVESILDRCKDLWGRPHKLRWHYRSQHESLIAFSNRHFYEDELIIFPSPNPNGRGIQWHYVEEGFYAKSRNVKEAEIVAKAVIDFICKNPEKSLGVGTFNLEQRDLILDYLDRYLREDSRARNILESMESSPEPFFVKNLENLQGDERDVIFISTTYGPDKETGKVFQRFGPILGTMGWRRLNVIFTRAKESLHLFTSMRSSDIVLGPNPSRGAQVLKDYLDYAETGKLKAQGGVTGRPPDSDFEVAVASAIKSLGYTVVPQVGVAGFFIDIGVLRPGSESGNEYMLGIECDGATYHSARSARDRDRLREEILKKLGWSLYRIWSTDWFKNRDTEMKRLESTLSKLKNAAARIGPMRST